MLSLYALMLVTMATRCHGFNLDLATRTVHHGPRGSMFGYTVAQHKDGTQNWILAGAPLANTTQEGVVEPGAVFRCPVTEDRYQEVPIDSTGNEAQWDGRQFRQIEEKSRQRLGASIYSVGTAGMFVACAPNYIYFTMSRNRREPVGACYVSTSHPTRYEQVSPCKKILREADQQERLYGQLPDSKTPYGFKDRGYCQSGFSSVMTSDAQRLVTGAVGSFFWQGQVFDQAVDDQQDVQETQEQSDNDLYDNSYLGYAMVTGHFNFDNTLDYAVSSPRLNYTGMVTLLADNLSPIATLDGLQMGEYFGGALATGDFNGDSRADVAVGAPFYHHAGNSAHSHDTGRVHVFYQTSPGTFSDDRTLLYGNAITGSRFGFALTSLGDLNQDGFDDLAVGAPYDGPQHRGVVYVYHGSRDGLITSPAQVIHAADIGSDVMTFGYALSAGQDQDFNLYPDLVVGAPNSDVTVSLRARPVIRVTVEQTLSPSSIILDNTQCELAAEVPVACFTIKACLKYEGVNVPREIVLDLQWRLDSSKTFTPRALVYKRPYTDVTRTLSMRFERDMLECTSFIAYVKERIRDKLSPIAVQLNYSLALLNNIPDDVPKPMLDQTQLPSVTSQAFIKKNCGADNICIPDLQLSVSINAEKYVLGTKSRVNVRVRVTNRREGSYESMVYVTLPAGVDYINIDRVQPKDYPVLCSSDSMTSSGETVVLCDVGNPLKHNRTVSFDIKTKVFIQHYMSPTLQILCVANSSNPENAVTLHDNKADVSLPVVVEARVQLTGVSNPEQVLYNSTKVGEIKTVDDVGPEVIHFYEVRNVGGSRIPSVDVTVTWPMFYSGGDMDLLYLATDPMVTRGLGHCSAPGVNNKNLTIPIEHDLDDEMYSSSLDLHAITDVSHRRKRRSIFDVDDDYIARVSCGVDGQECVDVKCTVGPLDPGQSALIQVNARVWIKTVLQLQSAYRGLIVTSSATAVAAQQQYNVSAQNQENTDTFQIETYVAALYLRRSRAALPWWLIAVSIVLGCIVLLIVILLLRQCGFFKRSKVLTDGPQYKVTVQKQDSADTSRDVTPVNGRYENLHSGSHSSPDVAPGNSLENPYRHDATSQLTPRHNATLQPAEPHDSTSQIGDVRPDSTSQLAERYESPHVAQQYDARSAAMAESSDYTDAASAPMTAFMNANSLRRYDSMNSTQAPFRYAPIPSNVR